MVNIFYIICIDSNQDSISLDRIIEKVPENINIYIGIMGNNCGKFKIEKNNRVSIFTFEFPYFNFSLLANMILKDIYRINKYAKIIITDVLNGVNLKSLLKETKNYTDEEHIEYFNSIVIPESVEIDKDIEVSARLTTTNRISFFNKKNEKLNKIYFDIRKANTNVLELNTKKSEKIITIKEIPKKYPLHPKKVKITTTYNWAYYGCPLIISSIKPIIEHIHGLEEGFFTVVSLINLLQQLINLGLTPHLISKFIVSRRTELYNPNEQSTYEISVLKELYEKRKKIIFIPNNYNTNWGDITKIKNIEILKNRINWRGYEIYPYEKEFYEICQF